MLGSDRDVPRSIIGFNPVACSWTCLVEIRVRGGLDVGSNKAVFGICFQSCYARRIRKTAETRRSCEPLKYSYVIFSLIIIINSRSYDKSTIRVM